MKNKFITLLLFTTLTICTACGSATPSTDTVNLTETTQTTTVASNTATNSTNKGSSNHSGNTSSNSSSSSSSTNTETSSSSTSSENIINGDTLVEPDMTREDKTTEVNTNEQDKKTETTSKTNNTTNTTTSSNKKNNSTATNNKNELQGEVTPGDTEKELEMDIDDADFVSSNIYPHYTIANSTDLSDDVINQADNATGRGYFWSVTLSEDFQMDKLFIFVNNSPEGPSGSNIFTLNQTEYNIMYSTDANNNEIPDETSQFVTFGNGVSGFTKEDGALYAEIYGSWVRVATTNDEPITDAMLADLANNFTVYAFTNEQYAVSHFKLNN